MDDVHTVRLVVRVHSHGECMGSDAVNGFTIVRPLFIVHVMVPIIPSVWVRVCVCRYSVGRRKYWNNKRYIWARSEDEEMWKREI